MKVLIALLALSLSGLSLAAKEKKVCNISFGPLDEAFANHRAEALMLKNALVKKGFNVIDDSELQEGDFQVQQMFDLGSSESKLPRSQIFHRFSAIYSGMDKDICRVNNTFMISQLHGTKVKDVSFFQIGFEFTDRYVRCDFTDGQYLPKFLAQMNENFPKCSRLSK
jgi:hypothetical protein